MHALLIETLCLDQQMIVTRRMVKMSLVIMKGACQQRILLLGTCQIELYLLEKGP